MMKWGKTTTGKQRWRCNICEESGVRKRPDTVVTSHRNLFVSWLTGTHTLSDFATARKISRQTLHEWFTPLWVNPPTPTPVTLDRGTLIVDAISLRGRKEVVLIGRTLSRMVFWSFAQHENYESWREFFLSIAIPAVVVCDGRRGLLQALREVFPQAFIQRCVIHIVRYALSLLTQKPKYQAGVDLRVLVKRIRMIRTRRQKRRWKRAFMKWCKKYHTFLFERTYGTTNKRSWWYTHRRLRTVRSLLLHALPHMFTYIGHIYIPRTTNHVEGGINTRAKELLERHRGLPLSKQQVMIAYYLSRKQGQKPTRKFT